MHRIAPAALLAGLALATWKPLVRIGVPEPVGRLDAWAIHGMSHARVDGIDPLQVALAALTTGLALADLRLGQRRAAVPAGLLLVVMIGRTLGHLPQGLVPDYGILGALGVASGLVLYRR